MKNIFERLNISQLLGLLLVAATLSSCTNDFEKLNIDPNRPENVNPGVILSQMQYRIVNNSITASRGFTHELMQVDAPRTSTSGLGEHRYIIGPGNWNNFYQNLTDIEDIINVSDELGENNYKAIGLVYKSWAYSILTDLYGDIPYSEAVRATDGIFQPKFDKQKDIYTQILKDLETANTLFDDTKVLTYGGDMVYGSATLTGGKNVGIQRWKKFTNSLRLRLLLRLTNKDGELNIKEQITSILADPVKFPTISTNAEEGIFRYPGTFPFFNPYFNARTLDWREGTYFTEFFINNLIESSDPRLAIWALPVNVGGVPTFRGIQSGYPTTLEYVVGQNSSYTDALKTLPQLGVMLPLAEVEFIKAELALNGYNTGKTVKQHYEAGITASMVQWGTSVPKDFFTHKSIAFDETAGASKQLEQIMLQKYYAYLFVDYQSWFEKRRTGLPVLPRGSGIPAANNFPSRVLYPTYLQSLNPDGLAAAITSIGGDNSDVKVWWNK
jgi:hypothetical protein